MLRVRRKKPAFRLVKNIPIPPVTPRKNWTCVASPAVDRAPVLLIPPLVTSKRPFVPAPLSIHRENGQRVVTDPGFRRFRGFRSFRGSRFRGSGFRGFRVLNSGFGGSGFRRSRGSRFPGTEPRTPNPEPGTSGTPNLRNPEPPEPRNLPEPPGTFVCLEMTRRRRGAERLKAAVGIRGRQTVGVGERRTRVRRARPACGVADVAIGERVSLSRACGSIARLETASVDLPIAFRRTAASAMQIASVAPATSVSCFS